MRAAAKFMFDTSFDAETDPVAPELSDAPEMPEAPAAPSYGVAELAAARDQGYADGRKAAEAEAASAAAHSAEAARQAIESALPGLARQIDDGLVACGRVMLETALAGMGRLMPVLTRRGGLNEIEGLLEQTLGELRDESRVVVRLEQSLLDGLRGRLDGAARAAGFEGRLVLLADDDMAVGDCRIEWAEGGVERAAGRIWNEIEAAVMRTLADACTTTGSGPDTVTTGSGDTTPQET